LLSIRLIKGDTPASIDSITPSQNPFEIRPALLFALLFALLSMITKWVTWNFGSSGLLILSAVVGVTDIDPYFLSFVRGPSSVQHHHGFGDSHLHHEQHRVQGDLLWNAGENGAQRNPDSLYDLGVAPHPIDFKGL
jgi:hypothetical protein